MCHLPIVEFHVVSKVSRGDFLADSANELLAQHIFNIVDAVAEVLCNLLAVACCDAQRCLMGCDVAVCT